MKISSSLANGLCIAIQVLVCSSAIALTQRTPNFVIIFTDDQGYADAGCYGSPDIRTPRLVAMATEGMKFTSFYHRGFDNLAKDRCETTDLAAAESELTERFSSNWTAWARKTGVSFETELQQRK